MRILMVCLGNICRSPTADAAVRQAAHEAGLDVRIDSAGTGASHIGASPDQRMTAAAAATGLPLAGEARQVTPEDLDEYDLVLAMDQQNLADLRRLAPHASERIHLFREWDPQVSGEPVPGVPDPYYGGPDGFAEVVRIVRRTAQALVDDLATRA